MDSEESDKGKEMDDEMVKEVVKEVDKEEQLRENVHEKFPWPQALSREGATNYAC